MIAKLKSNRVRRTYLGGARIEAFTGEKISDDGWLRPEDWLASTTTAFNGSVEIEGEGLGHLTDGRSVEAVVGKLPILVKLLDSDERLVVQAHPTVPFAREFMNSPVGKTECWYFLPGTTEEASVYLGFKPGITKECWRKAVENCCQAEATSSEELLSLLHRVPVKAGDFVFVDGGVPHAIGGGCFMIELQEPSDLMVVAERWTPSGREIPEKKLHCGLGWEKMFEVYEYRGYEYDELCEKYVHRRRTGGGDSVERLLESRLTDKFSMWRMRGNGAALDLKRSAIAIVVGGAGSINELPINYGDRLIIQNESKLTLSGKVELVVCS